MNPVGVVIALAIAFLVGLLCQKHGRRIGYDQGITDRIAYCARMQRLQRERDEAWTSLNLTLDAHDRQRALAERRFAELVEAEHARDSTARRLRDAEHRPSRVVAGPRAGWWT